MADRQSAIKELFESDSPYFKGELLPVQEDLKRAAQAKRKELAKLKAKGKLSREAVVQAQYDLSEAYHLAQERVRSEIDEEFAKLEQKWRKGRDPVQEMINLQRWQLEYNKLDKADLGWAVAEYSSSPERYDPDQVRCLEAAAAKAGAGGLDFMHKQMERAHWDRPWMRERPDLLKLRDLHSAEFGQARVMGPLGTDDYPIADLLDTTGDDTD